MRPLESEIALIVNTPVLTRDEKITELKNLFIRYAKKLIPERAYGQNLEPYVRGCRDGWNACRENIVSQIKKIFGEVQRL